MNFIKIKKLIKSKQLRKYLTRCNINYLFVVFAFVLGSFLNWPLFNIICYSAFIYFILFPKPSSFFARICIFCLCLIPILLFIHRGETAEQFSVLCFFALIGAVITSLLKNDRANGNINKK